MHITNYRTKLSLSIYTFVLVCISLLAKPVQSAQLPEKPEPEKPAQKLTQGKPVVQVEQHSVQESPEVSQQSQLMASMASPAVVRAQQASYQDPPAPFHVALNRGHLDAVRRLLQDRDRYPHGPDSSKQ